MEKYIDRLQNAFSLTTRRIGSELANHDGILTGPQYFILYLLSKKTKSTVTELAENMFVKPSGITTMIDRLYKAGLVLRDRDEEDRRVVFIQLTKNGREALDYAQDKRKKVFMKYLCHLNPQEMETLVSIYEKLANSK